MSYSVIYSFFLVAIMVNSGNSDTSANSAPSQNENGSDKLEPGTRSGRMFYSGTNGQTDLKYTEQKERSDTDGEGRGFFRDKLCFLGLLTCAAESKAVESQKSRIVDSPIILKPNGAINYPDSPDSRQRPVSPGSGSQVVVHHHIHHIPSSPENPADIGSLGVIGTGSGLSDNDGRFNVYPSGQKPSISFGASAGPNIPESPFPGSSQSRPNIISSNRGIDCRCVPISQCASYDIVQGQGSSDQETILRPNTGIVGVSIDPRHREPNINFRTESNMTDDGRPKRADGVPTGRSGFSHLNIMADINGDDNGENGSMGSQKIVRKRQIPQSPNQPANKRISGGITVRNCQGGYVCCRNPANRPPQQNYPDDGNTFQNGRPSSNNQFDNNGGFEQGQGQCGKRNARGLTGRVTTSNAGFSEGDTDYGEYPWQVAILKRDGKDIVFACGGSLLDSRHLLTAAHCIKNLNPSELHVRLGDWDLNHETEFYPFVERNVAGFAIHPDFYAGNLFNDIAIVRLEGHIDFRQNPHISPICIPPANYEFGGHRCFVTGWGKDAFGDGKYQSILKEVDVSILRHSECEQKLKRTKLGRDFILHPGFICAGGEEGKDACAGDGGGPLNCLIQGAWQLTGIVSWGVGCGQVDTPGVYVKVSHYRDWIQKTLNG